MKLIKLNKDQMDLLEEAIKPEMRFKDEGLLGLGMYHLDLLEPLPLQAVSIRFILDDRK